MPKTPVSRTPKVFHSTYQPAKQRDFLAQYRSLLPIFYIVVAVVGLLLVSRLPWLRIQTITVTGTEDQSIIANLNQLKEQSIFSRSVDRVINDLLNHNLAINTITCRRGIPNILQCQVSLRQPAVIWHKIDSWYLVDTNGLAYATTNGPNGKLVVEDRGTTAISVGDYVASSEVVTNYQQLAELITGQKLRLDHLFLTESIYQVGATLTGSDNTDVPFPNAPSIDALFVTNYSLDDQVKALVTVIRNKKDQIKQSVDLRVPGYSYYK